MPVGGWEALAARDSQRENVARVTPHRHPGQRNCYNAPAVTSTSQ